MQGTGISAEVLGKGLFPVLGEMVGGRWLGIIIASGALAGQIGLYNAVLLSVSRVPEVMAKDRLLPQIINRSHKRFGTPYVSIIICALVVSVLIFLEFESLIVIDVTLYGAGLFLEFVTLVVLRVKAPDAARPFRIRLPIAGLGAMYVLPIGIYTIALSGAFMDTGGGARPALFAGLALCSAELGWQLAKRFGRKKTALH